MLSFWGESHENRFNYLFSLIRRSCGSHSGANVVYAAGCRVFTKVLITLAVLFVVALGVTLVKKEYVEEKDMKDSGHID